MKTILAISLVAFVIFVNSPIALYFAKAARNRDDWAILFVPFVILVVSGICARVAYREVYPIKPKEPSS